MSIKEQMIIQVNEEIRIAYQFHNTDKVKELTLKKEAILSLLKDWVVDDRITHSYSTAERM